MWEESVIFLWDIIFLQIQWGNVIWFVFMHGKHPWPLIHCVHCFLNSCCLHAIDWLIHLLYGRKCTSKLDELLPLLFAVFFFYVEFADLVHILN